MHLRLPFVIRAKAFDKSFKGAKCVSITITSSNINEIIGIILNLFIHKFHNYKKAQNAYKRAKTKNVCKKYLSSNINNKVIKTKVAWVNGVVC